MKNTCSTFNQRFGDGIWGYEYFENGICGYAHFAITSLGFVYNESMFSSKLPSTIITGILLHLAPILLALFFVCQNIKSASLCHFLNMRVKQNIQFKAPLMWYYLALLFFQLYFVINLLSIYSVLDCLYCSSQHILIAIFDFKYVSLALW